MGNETIIPLRSYYKQIEKLIDADQCDQAIVHCMHILSLFPKALAVYELTSKAYLEMSQYDQARHYSTRYLASDPDNFSMNVCLSICVEENGNLDKAIYYMNRAFEIRPENEAVQSELFRLYGRRLGSEQESLGLPTGAFARIRYLEGEYDLAVNEIKNALKKDSERIDLELLLAFVYYKLQKSDLSIKICKSLLKKFPYLYDANRLVFAQSQDTRERALNFSRITQLEPYAKFSEQSIFDINIVADESIMVEKLIIPDPPTLSQAISDDDTDLIAPIEEMPDWMKVALEAELAKNKHLGKERVESFSTEPSRLLKVFLCHSSDDKPVVRKLYEQLLSEKNIEPWFDQQSILPGQDWDLEIRKAVRSVDIVIVCISKMSINKEGYIQKEIKQVLDIADEKPEDTIFLIPLKLEECNIPIRLSRWQWLNFYEEGAYEKLLRSLSVRALSLGIIL